MESNVTGELPKRFGRFLLLKQVAVGGMAEVLLAVEETEYAGRRFVSIKRIRPEKADDEDYIEFFLTEGRISLKCSHPNLPQAFDLGVEEGVHYLALEFIRGHTLLELQRAARAKKHLLSVPTVLRLGIEIAAALEYVHALRDVEGRPLGIIHRDVTPQNVMITASGAVKLIDFGIVRSTAQSHHTQNGIVKGKLSYLTPEMLDGRGRLDQRSDLFTLGVVLHELLTGRALFRGRNEQHTLDRIRNLTIPDPSICREGCPPALAAAVFKLLERDPRRRFQSATELLNALEAVAEICGIHHSLSRLREEMLTLCGRPPLPTLEPEVVEALARQQMDSDLANGSDTEVTGAAPSDLERLARDPDLVYYLERARAGKKSARRRTTQHDDPDFAELLSRMER